MHDITAEFSVTELAAPVELRVIPRLVVGGKTDIGRVREVNEDKFEFYIPNDEAQLASRGSVFVVCDGMGGHAAGQIASETSAKTFIDAYYQHIGSDPEEAARSAIHVAQRFILNIQATIPQRRGMGTTLEAVAICQDKAIIVHVGDSRIYRVRDAKLERVTHDHSWVQEMVDGGIMSEEAAELHQNRNVLTRCIGHEQDFRPDVFTLDLVPGDTFLLCSDGVTKCASEERISAIMSGGAPSQQAWDLIQVAMMGGGHDNATALIVHISAIDAVT
ncbi:MAG: serine/threonine-protein phosphatase [Chthonomonas sp.]|nr:serine/threonine-protein phosphatase [Chthonomonas sp.]